MNLKAVETPKKQAGLRTARVQQQVTQALVDADRLGSKPTMPQGWDFRGVW